MNIHRVLGICFASILLLTVEALASTSFYYTSSPDSWVGGGETVLVTPDQGFEFSIWRNFDNGVSISINDFDENPDSSSARWWYLDFAAPDNAQINVGDYLDATRYPFQASSEPGLNFSGNGRGNNELTGYFSIREAEYGADGLVLSFAADFTQYDEGLESWWNIGRLMYHSSIKAYPVPEPATLMLFLSGLSFLFAPSYLKRRFK